MKDQMSHEMVQGPITFTELGVEPRFGMVDMRDRGLFFPNAVKPSPNAPPSGKSTSTMAGIQVDSSRCLHQKRRDTEQLRMRQQNIKLVVSPFYKTMFFNLPTPL